MDNAKLIVKSPRLSKVHLMDKVVEGHTKVGNEGYVIEDPVSHELIFLSSEEYVEIVPKPINELDILRNKVYKYELMISRLLNYDDLVVIAAIKNELERVQRD